MIYDRTLTDVKNAIKIREEKIKNLLPLEADEVEILQKGLVTVDTINRIEKKEAELKSLINGIGYYNTNFINKEWNVGDFFKSEDLERIFNNAIILKNAFFTFYNTPKNANARYFFVEFNNLEKILVDIGFMIPIVKLFYNQCGTFNCGE